MSEEQSIIKVSKGLLAALGQGQLNINVFKKDILVLECVVAGTSYQQFDGIDSSLNATVKLHLVREPNNEFDAFAVAFHFAGTKVGYVPRERNEVIARLMDAGKTFFALVQAREWDGKWLKLQVKIYIHD